jgi:anti-sigma factor RsiW
LHNADDTPLTEEELMLARDGEVLIAAAVADVRAPQSLREAIERERDRAAARPRASSWWRPRRILAATLAAAAAVAVVAVVLGTGGGNTQPSLGDVYMAARLGPTKPAPPRLGGDPPVLAAKVGDLAFPDWMQKFGWAAVGRREDDLSGRRVTTVFYRNRDGAELGYAVVAGNPLGGQPAGRRVTREGKTYHARGGARTVVTWTQQGHTCVIVAPSTVPRSRLLDLAASRNV